MSEAIVPLCFALSSSGGHACACRSDLLSCPDEDLKQ